VNAAENLTAENLSKLRIIRRLLSRQTELLTPAAARALSVSERSQAR
jgi:hypothetical protein